VSAGPLPRSAARAGGRLHRLEDAVLALLLATLILLASLQIGLRSLLGTGLPWIDPTLRVLVLWLGMLGAVAASRDGSHISIDVLSRLLPARGRAAVTAGTALFTAVVCAIVAWHGGRFVASEFEYASAAFSGIPAWTLEAIIPFAFGAIALRYGRLALQEAHRALRPPAEDGGSAPGTDRR
jgi:TRAP-type C4-dicarboxylate transport system permease small subunit